MEFTDAIKRVRCLLDKFNPKYGFLSNYFGMMEQINLLRNRITHRGAFIIRPDALDELFGGYILPFVKVLEQNIEQYKLTLKSGFNLHSTNINPYDILIQEYNKELSVNKNKILVLKLIGLAAYQNDIPYFAIKNSSDSLDEDTILATFYNHEKQKIAERAYSSANVGRIEKCPVCGCDSFCLEYDTYEGELGDIPYVYEGSCFHCGFRLKGDLLKPNINGLELPDYFIIDN